MKAFKADFDKMVPEKQEMSGCIIYMPKTDNKKGFVFGSGHGFLYPWEVFPSGAFEPFGGFEIADVSEEVALEKFIDASSSFKIRTKE